MEPWLLVEHKNVLFFFNFRALISNLYHKQNTVISKFHGKLETETVRVLKCNHLVSIFLHCSEDHPSTFYPRGYKSKYLQKPVRNSEYTQQPGNVRAVTNE